MTEQAAAKTGQTLRWIDLASMGMRMFTAKTEQGNVVLVQNGDNKPAEMEQLKFKRGVEGYWYKFVSHVIPQEFLAVFPDAKQIKGYPLSEIVIDFTENGVTVPGVQDGVGMAEKLKPLLVAAIEEGVSALPGYQSGGYESVIQYRIAQSETAPFNQAVYGATRAGRRPIVTQLAGRTAVVAANFRMLNRPVATPAIEISLFSIPAMAADRMISAKKRDDVAYIAATPLLVATDAQLRPSHDIAPALVAVWRVDAKYALDGISSALNGDMDLVKIAVAAEIKASRGQDISLDNLHVEPAAVAAWADSMAESEDPILKAFGGEVAERLNGLNLEAASNKGPAAPAPRL